MSIESVTPDLVNRQRTIDIQIGLDMNALHQRLLALEACCEAKHRELPLIDSDPVPEGDELSLLNAVAYVEMNGAAAGLKRDIKLIPVDDTGLMDMALTEEGDLLHDAGLETAVLMSLFSDRRFDGERGFWADEIIGRKTGSHLWLLKREKTTGPEHREGSVLRRAEDYAREALKWMLLDRTALRLSVTAHWGESRVTERLILAIEITLPDGSRFIGY